MIVTASHLNGFVDPVLLVTALGWLPRFLAKATLWRVLPARPFLALARIIPVQRRQDHDGTASNTATFAAAVDALAAGATVAIFPEGTTHDRPHLVELRTGVARIALQAVDSGVDDLRIVPVGIAYEDKVALRGRALIVFAQPIDVAAEVTRLRAEAGGEREVARALTDVVERRLRAVSPDFRSSMEAVGLTGGGEGGSALPSDRPRSPPPLARSARWPATSPVPNLPSVGASGPRGAGHQGHRPGGAGRAGGVPAHVAGAGVVRHRC